VARFGIGRYLPQPVEDDKITGALSQLRDRIKNHAQSYYHIGPVEPAMVDLGAIQELAQAMKLPAAGLRDALLNPQSRIAAIRLYLSWVVLSRSGVAAGGRDSLLPPEVALFAAGLEDDGSSEGYLALTSKWKAISGTLLAARYNNPSTETDPRGQSITHAIAAADLVLLPFTSNAASHRARNLDGLVRRGAQLVFLLFSQPSVWKFDWAGNPQRGSLIVFPALLQTADEEGCVVHPPRVFTELEAVEGGW